MPHPLERLLALLRRRHTGGEWVAPGNAITRAIEAGRDFAPLQVPHATILPSVAQAPTSNRDLVAAIEAALREPVFVEEPPRIVISDDSITPELAAPAASAEGVLREKKPKRRWWRRAA